MAFGPGRVDGTASPNSEGNCVIAGHRDTHFSFLKELKTGDLLRLHTTTEIRDYRVRWQEAVDSRKRQLVIDDNMERLTLLTCYPFESAIAGGPLRWVVTALPDS